MTQTITKPILLDETGREIASALRGINNAIEGLEQPKSTWSITINLEDPNPALPAMGGDVTSWLRYRAKIGRYLLTNDGKAYKLDRHDSHFLENGHEVNENIGNIMVRIPRIYYRCDESDGIATLTLCERSFADSQTIDEQWVGAYLGSIVDDALTSRSGNVVTASKEITAFWDAAQKNGTDFGLMNYRQLQLIIMIYLCEFLDFNSQQIGLGMTGEGDNWCDAVKSDHTGATAGLGDECGRVEFLASVQKVSGACHVSLFGLEDLWGWFMQFIQGIYFGSSINTSDQDGTECFIYERNDLPQAMELGVRPTSNYRQITRPISSGWIKTLFLGKYFDIIPRSLGDSSVTYMCDEYKHYNTGQIFLYGGSAVSGSGAGLFSISSHYFDYNDVRSYDLSSRLAYYGKPKILQIDSADIATIG